MNRDMIFETVKGEYIRVNYWTKPIPHFDGNMQYRIARTINPTGHVNYKNVIGIGEFFMGNFNNLSVGITYGQTSEASYVNLIFFIKGKQVKEINCKDSIHDPIIHRP